MKNLKRRNEARQRAEEYAPRPVDSLLMYGVVGVGLAGVGLVAFSGFYGLDPLAYPLWVALALTLVFAGSLVLWTVRNRRHNKAHRTEYDRTDRH